MMSFASGTVPPAPEGKLESTSRHLTRVWKFPWQTDGSDPLGWVNSFVRTSMRQQVGPRGTVTLPTWPQVGQRYVAHPLTSRARHDYTVVKVNDTVMIVRLIGPREVTVVKEEGEGTLDD